MDPQRIEAYVDTAAAALDLPLAPAHRPGVVAYFALAASLAESVAGAALAPADEAAPVFTPIAPDDLPGDDPRSST
ncbi:MAG TPA: AtzG-like protein [Caldimonas sp.]|nr:AtzG-like protein [Caldimonas sp.]